MSFPTYNIVGNPAHIMHTPECKNFTITDMVDPVNGSFNANGYIANVNSGVVGLVAVANVPQDLSTFVDGTWHFIGNCPN